MPIQPEDDGTETHLVMTGEGFRVEKREPLPTPGPLSYFIAAVVIFFLTWFGGQ